MELFIKRLLDYVSYTDLANPHLVTFTSKYTKSLSGKFRLLRRWKQYRLLMTSALPYREYHFQPIAWAMEYSENAVHLHCISEGSTSVRVLNHSWISLNRHDLGNVDIRRFDSYDNAFRYAFKDYIHQPKLIDKFIGHFVTLRSQGLNTYQFITKQGTKRKRNRLGQFARTS